MADEAIEIQHADGTHTVIHRVRTAFSFLHHPGRIVRDVYRDGCFLRRDYGTWDGWDSCVESALRRIGPGVVLDLREADRG